MSSIIRIYIDDAVVSLIEVDGKVDTGLVEAVNEAAIKWNEGVSVTIDYMGGRGGVRVIKYQTEEPMEG